MLKRKKHLPEEFTKFIKDELHAKLECKVNEIKFDNVGENKKLEKYAKKSKFGHQLYTNRSKLTLLECNRRTNVRNIIGHDASYALCMWN